MEADITEVKLDGAAFGRHVHCCSAWRYAVSSDRQTFGTLTCSLLISLEIFKVRCFEATLSIPLEVFSANPALVDLFKLFMHHLTDEHYIEGQEEETDDNAHLLPGDNQPQKLKKILQALTKLNIVSLLENARMYATTEEHARHLIALFEFFLELKVKYRQAGYAFVDIAKLPQDKRFKTAYAYGEINPLRDLTGWTTLPLSDQKAATPAYCVLFRDIQELVRTVLHEIGKPQPATIDFEMIVERDKAPLTLSVTITPAFAPYQGGRVVILTATTSLPEGRGMLTTHPFGYPQGCKEHQAKLVIALLLCEMKRIYYKNQS